MAADVRQYDLANHAPADLKGAVYMPYPQAVGNNGQLPTSMTLLVRTDSDPTAVADRIRDLVRELNPNVPVSEVQTMAEVVSTSTSQPRSMMWLFLCFALAALLLAAVGTYGVVSYSTARRTFEIGMRIALGASRRSIFRLVLGQSLKLASIGLVVGLGIALAVTRMLVTFLYGVTPTDPLTFFTVGTLLLAIALVAGYIPARRAASLDPLSALRME